MTTREQSGALGPAASARDLRTLPKAELHLHLLAAMRPTTLVELAAEDGRTAPDPRGFTSFAEFQQVFHAAYQATSARPEQLRRVVTELVEDTAADGGVWVQPTSTRTATRTSGPGNTSSTWSSTRVGRPAPAAAWGSA